MKRLTLAAVLGVLLLTTSVVVGVADFTVSIPGSIDTPEKTLSVEGDSYTISSIARVEKGNTLSVETSAPSDEEYRVYIHGVEDGSRQVQDTRFVAADDDGSVSFDTSEFSPGSYTVSIYDSDTGKYYSPHPVVVPAFETSVEAPDTATSEHDFEVNVTTDRIESGPSVSGVELVFMQGETTKRVDTSESDGNYTASVSLPETGDWNVYAAVKGTEDAPRGEKELIGLSDSLELSIESKSTTTPTTTTPPSTATTSTDDDTGDGNDGGGSRETTEAETTTTSQSGTTVGTSTTMATSTSDSPNTAATDTSVDSTETQSTQGERTTTSTDSQTTSDVIEPNTGTAGESSNGVAGGIPLVLVALLATARLLIRDP